MRSRAGAGPRARCARRSSVNALIADTTLAWDDGRDADLATGGTVEDVVASDCDVAL